jgi:hypothetical protein
MEQRNEYLTVKVPAGTKAQTKALNKLAQQGWEVVDKRQLWGAGVATVSLKRPYATPAPAAAPQRSLLTVILRALSSGSARG